MRWEEKCVGRRIRLCQIKNGVKGIFVGRSANSTAAAKKRRDESSDDRTTEKETEDSNRSCFSNLTTTLWQIAVNQL